MSGNNYKCYKARNDPCPFIPNNSDDENFFQVNFVLDESNKEKVSKHFFDATNPSKYVLQKVNITKSSITTSSSKTNAGTRNEQKERRVDATDSPFAVSSFESFHSCQSARSDQDLESDNDIDHISFSEFKKADDKISSNINHSKQLTLVNAIFLNNSDRQHLKCADSKGHEKEKLTNKRSKSSNTSSLLSVNPISKTVKPCKGNHNSGFKRNKKHVGRRIGNQLGDELSNTFNTLEEDILAAQTTISKYFRSSQKSPSDLLSDYKINEPETNLVVLDAPPLNVPTKTNSYLNLQAQQKVLKIKTPKPDFEEVFLASLNSHLTTVMEFPGKSQLFQSKKSEIHPKKRKMIPGCERKSKLNDQKTTLTDVPKVESGSSRDEINFKFGDGDFSKTKVALNEEDNRKDGGETLSSTIDDSSLRKFVRNILNKINNENNKGNSGVPVFDYVEEFDDKSFNREDVSERQVIGHPKANLTDISNSTNSKTRRNNSVCEGNPDSVNLTLSNNEKKKCSEIREFTNQRLGMKRVGFERPSNLPMIKEESSEERLEERSYVTERSFQDDFFLVDSQGRPICLFDSQGSPLTDLSGRPLRSSQGKMLLKCDENGIPVVDSKDRDCDIFDTFGRQPHEPDFDPSEGPKMAAASKLSTRDGKPLLLFDSGGRPLTSVSGTILVDVEGQGLVQIS